MGKLIQAVQLQDIGEVKKLLLTEYNTVERIDEDDELGWNPLSLAAYYGFKEIILVLISAGAKADKPNKRGETPLYIAAYQGHHHAAEALLEAGANVIAKTAQGYTSLAIAAINGHTNILNMLLNKGVKLDQSDDYGRTPVFFAAMYDQVKTIRYLNDRHVQIDKANSAGETPLFIAAHKANVAATRALIFAEADLNQPRNDRATPLFIAADHGFLEIVQMLLHAGANVDQARDDGFTPLMIAALHGHERVVCALLQAGAKVNHARQGGRTALFSAVERGHVKTVYVLLHAGAEIDIKAGKRAITPLFVAVENGSSEAVKILLAYNADANYMIAQGRAVDVAERNNRKDIVNIFRIYFANKSKKNLKESDNIQLQWRKQVDLNIQELLARIKSVLQENQNKIIKKIEEDDLECEAECAMLLQILEGSHTANMPITPAIASTRQVVVSESKSASPSRPLDNASKRMVSGSVPANQTNSTTQKTSSLYVPMQEVQLQSMADLMEGINAEHAQCSSRDIQLTTSFADENSKIKKLERDIEIAEVERNSILAEMERIKSSRQDGSERLSKLEAELSKIAEKQAVLWEDHERKQAKKAAMLLFQTDPRLVKFYLTIAISLEKVIVGCVAAASGLMSLQAGGLQNKASQLQNGADLMTVDGMKSGLIAGVKKIGEMVGKNTDKIISNIGQGVTLLGYTFEFLPGMGMLLKGAGMALNKVAEIRQENFINQLANQSSMMILLKAVGMLARHLTSQYERQIRSLPTQEEDDALQNSFRKSVQQLKSTVLQSAPPSSSIERLAEYAVLRVLDSFYKRELASNPLDAESWMRHWLRVIQYPGDNIKYLLEVNNVTISDPVWVVTTRRKKRWDIRLLFVETGICTKDVPTEYYAFSREKADHYGFRDGDHDEAIALKMQKVLAPGAETGVRSSALAETSLANRRELQNQGQRIAEVAAQQELFAKQQARVSSGFFLAKKKNDEEIYEEACENLKMNLLEIFAKSSIAFRLHEEVLYCASNDVDGLRKLIKRANGFLPIIDKNCKINDKNELELKFKFEQWAIDFYKKLQSTPLMRQQVRKVG